MKIENNYNNTELTQAGRANGNKINGTGTETGKKTEEGVSIKGMELNLGEDLVEEKRKKARSMALQLMLNVFSNDTKLDEEEKTRSDHAKKLVEDSEQCRKMIADIDKERDITNELYGVNEDSSEWKELELLRKGRQAVKNPNIEMSEQEWKEYHKIYERGLTEYQNRMLELDDNEQIYQKKIKDNQKGIIEEYAIVRGMKIERLKTHAMYDAVQQGEQIMDAAGEEIKGILVQDMVDNIDEEFEEEKEEALEKKQEKEELEERIERAKGEKADKEEDEHEEMYELDNILNEVRNMGQESTLPDISKSLEFIVSELKLDAEDVKGIVLDKEI